MQDLERTLFAEIGAMPPRRAETIGAKLGVRAMPFVRRCQRRAFLDGRGQTAAAAVVKRLPRPGESLHFILDGSFALAHVIPRLQELLRRPVKLTVATLGLNADTTNLLAAMLKDGRVQDLRLAISSYFRAADPETAAHAITTLTKAGAQVACERLHAKVHLCSPAFVLETSANLRSCNCIEVGSITNDPKLHAWHNTWLTEFFNKHSIV